jgi:hypothetical protein
MAALPVHVTAAIPVELDRLGATPDAVELSIKGRQEVEWFCWDPNKTLIVKFKPLDAAKPGWRGSPFQASEFKVEAGKTTRSGPPRSTADLGLYKYSIWDGGVETADPEIIIRG